MRKEEGFDSNNATIYRSEKGNVFQAFSVLKNLINDDKQKVR